MATGQITGDRPVIEVARLSTQPEFKTAVELQRTIWGFADIELLPVRLFVVASKIGGQVLGAFDGELVIGFSLAIPRLKQTPPGDRAHAAVNGRPVNRPAIEATIEIPNAIAELRQTDPKQAREIQKAAGERFQKLFDMGLAVIGFDRSETAGSYLLGFWK